MKIKKILIKLLVSTMIILTLANFIGSTGLEVNYSFADPEPPEQVDSTDPATQGEEKTNGLLGSIISGITGAVINFVKWIIVTPIRAMRSLNFTLASAGGTVNGVSDGEITPFDIFFNKFTLLDANIFSTTNRDGDALDPDSIVYKIRVNTSMWYYAIRALAIIAVSIMLLWNLIRAISKSTSPEQKTIAKNSLIDWVLSFALIMFMHIIIILVLNINDIILSAIYNFTPVANVTDFLDSLENVIFSQNLTLSVAAIVVYAMLNWQTFKFILVYVQRLLTIVLLVMISPLVPVTYSTDRMRGGRGAALNGWLRELVYNVFVQSIHALIYASLVGVAMAQLTDHTVSTTNDLGIAFIAVATMLFVKPAERLIKTIFGFNNSQMLTTNIFSNVANVARGAAGMAGRATIRAATGGPFISFGRNVDGSHIGIGQVASGLGNSFSNSIVGAAGAINSGVTGGIRTARDAYSALTGRNPAEVQAEQEESAVAQADEENVSSANGENGVDGQNGQNGENGENGNSTVVVGGASREALEQAVRQVNSEMSEENKGNNTETTETTETRETTETIETTETAESSETTKNSDTSNNVENNQSVEVENVESEVVEEEEENDEDSIPIMAGEGIDPDLLEKFKTEFKAILHDDRETIDNWAQEVQDEMDELEDKLDEITKKDIIDEIGKNWNDEEKLKDYINSFEEGSNERKYAEAVADLYAYVELDDEKNLTKEQQLEALISAYNAKGLEIPKEYAKINDAGLIDQMALKTKPEAKAGADEKVDVTGEEADDNSNSNVIDLSEARDKRIVKDLARLDPERYGQRVNVHGKFDGEVESEIKTDYEANIESLSNRVGSKPDLDSIFSQMEKESQDRLMQYNRREISEDELDEQARDFAILERQAMKLGYITTTRKASSYEVDVDGEHHTTSSSKGVIDILEAQRAKNMQTRTKNKESA